MAEPEKCPKCRAPKATNWDCVVCLRNIISEGRARAEKAEAERDEWQGRALETDVAKNDLRESLDKNNARVVIEQLGNEITENTNPVFALGMFAVGYKARLEEKDKLLSCIASMAGAPDPAEACRNIIKAIKEGRYGND